MRYSTEMINEGGDEKTNTAYRHNAAVRCNEWHGANQSNI